MVDKGHGYDISDSFVDDSELVSRLLGQWTCTRKLQIEEPQISRLSDCIFFLQYEDFVPPQVDTVLGGFYINTGTLDFKCRDDLDPE